MKVLLIDLTPFTEAVTPVSLGYIGAALAGSGHEVKVISIGQSSTVSLAGLERFLGEFQPDAGGIRHLSAEPPPHHRAGSADQAEASPSVDRARRASRESDAR